MSFSRPYYLAASAAGFGTLTAVSRSPAAQCHSAAASLDFRSADLAARRKLELEQTLTPVRLLPRVCAFAIDSVLLTFVTWALRKLFGVDPGAAWAKLTNSMAWSGNEAVQRIADRRVARRRKMAKKSWWCSADAEESVEDVRADAFDVLSDAAGLGQTLSEWCSAIAAVQLARTPYCLLSHWLLNGATIGERAVGLRVVTTAGDEATLVDLLKRESVEGTLRALTFGQSLRKQPKEILEGVVAPLEVHEVVAIVDLGLDDIAGNVELQKRMEDFAVQVGGDAGQQLPKEFYAIVPPALLIAARLGVFTGIANLVLIKKAGDGRTIGDLLAGTRVVYASEHDTIKKRWARENAK